MLEPCQYCKGSGVDPASVELNAQMERSFNARGGRFDGHADRDSFCEQCPNCEGDGEIDTENGGGKCGPILYTYSY